MSGISPEVLAALRASLAAQTRELDELRDALRSLQQERDQEVNSWFVYLVSEKEADQTPFRLQRLAVEAEFASMSDTILSLRQQLEAAQTAKEEVDHEQEDLLVLLDDLNEKRKQDKRRMRAAALEVSEDEDGVDGDEDEEGAGGLEEEKDARDEAGADELHGGGNAAAEEVHADTLSAVDPSEPSEPHAPTSEVASEPPAPTEEVTPEASNPPEVVEAPEADVASQPFAENGGQDFDDADDDPYRPRPSTTPPLPEEHAPEPARDNVYGDSSELFTETADEFAISAAAPESSGQADTVASAAAPSADMFAPTSAYEPQAEAPTEEDRLPTADYEAASATSLPPPNGDAAEARQQEESTSPVGSAVFQDLQSATELFQTQAGVEDQAAATSTPVSERPQTPQQAPPPPKALNSLRATPRRPPREREGRELIEPHVVDEEDFRPRSATPIGVPPPPRSSAPPPPRASAAPPPRATGKSAPRRAFFGGLQAAAPQETAPPGSPSSVASVASGQESTRPSYEAPPPAADVLQQQNDRSTPQHVLAPGTPSAPSPLQQTSSESSNLRGLVPEPEASERSTTPAGPPPAGPTYSQSAMSSQPAAAEDRRTSIDDRLAAAFGGGGDSFADGDNESTSLFTAPSRDVSALFGGAVSAASRTANSFFGAGRSSQDTLEAIAGSTEDEFPAGRRNLASPPPDLAGAAPAESAPLRSAASLFGGAASAATSLFSGLGSENGRHSQPEPRQASPTYPPKTAPRARPESQDVASLFGGAGDTASLFGGSAGHNQADVAAIFGHRSSSPPAAAHGSHADAAWRRDQKPAQSDVRDVSSLFG